MGWTHLDTSGRQRIHYIVTANERIVTETKLIEVQLQISSTDPMKGAVDPCLSTLKQSRQLPVLGVTEKFNFAQVLG